MASGWQFRSIPLYKISFCNVVKGRVGCNILFSTSLRILGESPGQSVRGSKLFSITLASLAFFLIHVKAMHHRASTILMVFSDRRSNFLIGFRTIFEFRLRTGRYVTDTQNLIWGLHSVPPYTPYTTELVVAGSNLRTSLRSCVNYGTGRSGSKAYRNDQLWKTSVESHLVKHIYTVH